MSVIIILQLCWAAILTVITTLTVIMITTGKSK